MLLNNASDVTSLLGGKLALKYTGRPLDAMTAVASACVNRSLAEFEQALVDFKVWCYLVGVYNDI
jgi:26S proteasome regulatory subunit N6